MGDLHSTICPKCGRHHPELEDCRDYVLVPVQREFIKGTTMTFLPKHLECQTELRAAGRAYPRTCEGCGLNGPCKHHAAPGDKFGQQWFADTTGAPSEGPGFLPWEPVKLIEGYWLSNRGVIFKIAPTPDHHFAAVNNDGKVEIDTVVRIWTPDGRPTMNENGHRLIRRVTVTEAPKPRQGKVRIAIIGQADQSVRVEMLPSGIIAQPATLAIKIVDWMEGDTE